MKNTKKVIPFAVLALTFSLAACNKGNTTSTPKELTILEKLTKDIEGGNGHLHADNYGDIYYIDKDTHIEEYLGDNAYYYYNSGLAFVEGVGYCSFTQLETEDGEKLDGYKFSNIQLPCNEKFDYSDIMYNLSSLTKYDATKATVNNGVATIADTEYATMIANMVGADYSYIEVVTDVTVTSITNGYEFAFNFDLTKSEFPLDPYECKFQVTDLGKTTHTKFENYLKSYTPVGLREGFGDLEETLAVETEPLMANYLKNTFNWSIASVATYSPRMGLYLYDYGCGDKLEQIKDDLVELGYVVNEDLSREGGYDLIIETHATTEEGVEYVSGKYEVFVSYDSPESMQEQMDRPENMYPNGAVIINFYHANYLAPGELENKIANIEYYPGKKCPTFSFENIEYIEPTIDEENYGDYAYSAFGFVVEDHDDAKTLFERYLAVYDANEGFTKESEEVYEDSFYYSASYSFEQNDSEEGVTYFCDVSFMMEVDEWYYGDDAVRCSYYVSYYYTVE